MHLFPSAAWPRLPLSTAVALLAVLALMLVAVLSGCGPGTAATSVTVPPYYAETIAIQPPAYDSPLNVSIRDTATGDESAALRALPPYQSIGFIVGTGKPNWWIVGAQRWHPVICCALSSTDFPHILWVSPHGTLLIADGMSTQNQGRSCSCAPPTERCSSFPGRA